MGSKQRLRNAPCQGSLNVTPWKLERKRAIVVRIGIQVAQEISARMQGRPSTMAYLGKNGTKWEDPASGEYSMLYAYVPGNTNTNMILYIHTNGHVVHVN